jgi:hypothetical protein
MTLKEISLTPENADAEALMEAHRLLLAAYTYGLAQEQDTYSLAQPSPYRFVPSIASNQMPPVTQGE